MEGFKAFGVRGGQDHEEVVVFWEEQKLSIEGVGPGQGVGVRSCAKVA